MTEALAIIDESSLETGTRDDRLAAYASARERIWDIADRAGADSGAIRGLTRGLETSEQYLVNGLWEDPPPAGQDRG
ncbi:hypothetical protein ABZX12_32350 [Kribbella sp. NPDC003505]|uniref:hypothetical protein n=1 Tax=Kribbella sp. NPDC003505 TaxID=3154448 RepID=UPI0033A5E452